MASVQRFVKVMLSQYKKATSEADQYTKYYMDPNDVGTWYVLISGMDGDDDEFTGGEFIVRMVAPNGSNGKEPFPFSPPEFYFMTPTNIYDVEKKVCISIGEFHANDYRATLGMSGFVANLISGMIGWKSLGGGINIVNNGKQVGPKIQASAASKKYNIDNHGKLRQQILDSYADYSSRFILDESNPKCVPLFLQKKLKLGKFGDEIKSEHTE